MKNDKTKSQKPNKIILGRTLILMLVCGILAFSVLSVKLYQVQVRDHEYYENKAVTNQTRTATVTASRGTITDRNGNILAISATAETIFISPYEIQLYEEDINLIARELSRILDVDYDSIIEKSKDTSSWYKTIAKKVDTEIGDEIRAFKKEYGIKGVHVETDSKRYYPYSTLASHVVGFAYDDSNVGGMGIELTYDEYLQGTDGSIIRLSAANGTEMLFTNYEYYFDAENGCDVELTLDVTMQYIVEKYLDQAIEENSIQSGGCCIIMNAKTGEILALASQGDFDPNNYNMLSDEDYAQLEGKEGDEYTGLYNTFLNKQFRNKAISDTYEPGSVFKIVTLAMALEEGTATMNNSYYCGGTINVLGRDPVHCWKHAGHGSQTLTEAVQHSCNVAFVQIGFSVGASVFYNYCESFGLFEKTGVELVGESNSQWWSTETFVDKDNMSQYAAATFGQTFNVTPIQMITAIAATVNGGYLVEPYIVREVTDSNGDIVTSNETTVVRQVVSEETSATVREILEQVVGGAEGTGKNASVAGYRIGGKTGTTTKTAYEAETGIREYMVSFCAVAPADDPEIVVLLVLDNPKSQAETGIYVSGGVMAAPAVGKILSEVLPYLGVEPDYSNGEEEYLDVRVSNVKNRDVTEATATLTELGLEVKIIGEGGTVTAQLPSANAEVTAGTTVILYCGEEPPSTIVTVPNLEGKTAAAARDALASVGLFLDTSGTLPIGSKIVVSSQSVEAGTEVEYGSVITVTMIDNTQLGQY